MDLVAPVGAGCCQLASSATVLSMCCVNSRMKIAGKFCVVFDA